MTSPFLHTPLRVLLVGSNFCRSNEPRDAYGASCLVSAFRNSPANAGDTLDVFTSDLNRFQKVGEGFDIDWMLTAEEIVTRALIGGYNVVAFSVFAWCEKMVTLAGAELRRRAPGIFIMLGGASIFGSEAELRKSFPFADMFTLSYGEKIFANLRHYNGAVVLRKKIGFRET